MRAIEKPVPVEVNGGRRSVSGMVEGIQGIQHALMVDHARLVAKALATEAEAHGVQQQVAVLQSVLDAPFAQPGQREDTSE